MLYLILLTPLLGFIKNYVKYKKINFFVFIRTPIVYLILQILIQTNNIWKLLILERWTFFIIKIIKSLINNDYIVKKRKYIRKYNINYKEKEIINKLSPMEEVNELDNSPYESDDSSYDPDNSSNESSISSTESDISSDEFKKNIINDVDENEIIKIDHDENIINVNSEIEKAEKYIKKDNQQYYR